MNAFDQGPSILFYVLPSWPITAASPRLVQDQLGYEDQLVFAPNEVPDVTTIYKKK